MNEAPHSSWYRSWWNSTADHYGLLVVLLLAVLILSGVSDHGWVRLVAALINLSALLVGYLATRAHGRLWSTAALLTTAIAGIVLVSTLRSDHVATALGSTIQVVVLGTLTLAVLARLLEHERVSNQTMLGAIASYLLIGQVFAWIYLALPGFVDESVLAPAQDGEIPIYYSYVVLTTLGFGDINPIGPLAQRITVLEAIIGQLFLAILLARLVSVYSRDEPPLRPGGSVTGPSI